MSVRLATPRELDRLAALFSLLLHHHDAGEPRFARDPGSSDDALRGLLARRLADDQARVFVAEAAAQQPSGTAAGVATDLPGLCVASLLERPPLFRETRRGEIEHLVVRPDARRRGVGRALVDAAVAWLREAGAGSVDAQVARSNAEGQAFWRAQGFGPSMDVLARRL